MRVLTANSSQIASAGTRYIAQLSTPTTTINKASSRFLSRNRVSSGVNAAPTASATE